MQISIRNEQAGRLPEDNQVSEQQALCAKNIKNTSLSQQATYLSRNEGVSNYLHASMVKISFHQLF